MSDKIPVGSINQLTNKNLRAIIPVENNVILRILKRTAGFLVSLIEKAERGEKI